MDSFPSSIKNFYKKYANVSGKYKTTTVKGKSVFIIDQKYQIIDSIGQGAYGVVVAAKDLSVEGQVVAIKQIEQAFEHQLYSLRTLRELKLLRLLQHENIINLETILLPPSREDFNDIYVVFELMETDLGAIIKAQQSLTNDQNQYLLYQILRALKYLHGAKVLHRDLKPRNLLMNKNCDLKLCDFGLSRYLDPCQKTSAITDYVVTRWYRAPELLLSFYTYDEKSDVWSTGIIFAEMLKQKPYMPGNSTRDQLDMIFGTLGTPDKVAISHIPKPQYREFVEQYPNKKGIPFQKQFEGLDPLGIDLISQMLCFDNQKRISIEQAIKHPYLETFHDAEDEPVSEQLNPLEFEFEGKQLTRAQLTDLIYEEVLLYHFPGFKKEYEEKLSKKVSVQLHIFENDNQNVKDPVSSDDDSD